MSAVPGRVLASVFLRSFLIQGSWNYRTMIGGGFGFAIMPALRWLYRGREEELARAAARHTQHFNAHPYMAGLAIGATIRLEGDGASSDAVERFKSAVRGPLGGLGDRLVWTAWLPFALLIGLILVAAGAGPAVVVVAVLAVYNVGHLAFRGWAYRAGLEAGPTVARSLHAADLGGKSDRVQALDALLLGVLLGLLTVRAAGYGAVGWGVLAAGGVALAVGARGGARLWKKTAGGVAVVIIVLLISGLVT